MRPGPAKPDGTLQWSLPAAECGLRQKAAGHTWLVLQRPRVGEVGFIADDLTNAPSEADYWRQAVAALAGVTLEVVDELDVRDMADASACALAFLNGDDFDCDRPPVPLPLTMKFGGQAARLALFSRPRHQTRLRGVA